MEQAIAIIKSTLKGNGIHSDEIDFIVKYLIENEELLTRLYKDK